MRFANEPRRFTVEAKGKYMTESEEFIRVEVAYALPSEQIIIALDVPGGITLEEAIQRSGILTQFPDIDLNKNKVGIFSKICKKDQVLRNMDRVEIYRPLIADPKAIRKQRAAEGKAMKKGTAEA